MSRPAVEFIRFQTNKAFLSQPSLFRELQTGALEGGIKSQFHGLSHEKPNEAAWILFHDKLSDRENFKWPEARGDFIAKLLEVCDGQPTHPWVIEVDTIPVAAVEAPVTEVAHFTFKPTTSIEDIAGVMEDLSQLTNGGYIVGSKGGVWGYHSDNDHKASALVGWDSLEAHEAATRLDAVKVLVQRLGELAEVIDVGHVQLEHFTNSFRGEHIKL